MIRPFPFTIAMLVLQACAPPQPAPSSSAGPDRHDVSAPTAAQFDVGPVESASAYLAEPQFVAADLERGELLSLACIACHTLREGEAHLIGPNLGGLFGARAGRKPGFDYSPALARSALIWTPRALDAWLAAPGTFVPGTSMVFAGYGAPADRRDLIAYLLHVTQEPVP